MEDLLQRLSRIDLDNAGRNLLAFFSDVDPCFLGLVVGVFLFLGSRVVAGQPALRSWGLRLAATAFLAYGGYLHFEGRLHDGSPLWKDVLRCACVGGVVLAGSWIVLPILTFVHRRFRLAVAVFLGYATYVAVSGAEINAETVPVLAFQGLGVALLALVIAWIVDPVWNALVTPLLPVRTEPPKPVEESKPLTVCPPMAPPSPALLSVLDNGPEAQRRRDRVRMQVELTYLQVAPGVSNAMPRHVFDDFVRRHLGDHLPPQDVEENARQLLAVLRQQHTQTQERGEFTTLEELADWLLAEQQRIQAQPLEQPARQTQLLDLHQRYLLMATRMMQKQTTLPC